MKKLYIFSLVLDILEFIARCISNTIDKFTPRNKNYEDIVSIEYNIELKETSTTKIIYNKDKYSTGIDNIWDKKIALSSNKFQDIIYYLKKNNVLHYKKYYHSLYFHSYADMYEEDDGVETEETITIMFKDGTKRNITSLDNNKKVSNIIEYLKNIN